MFDTSGHPLDSFGERERERTVRIILSPGEKIARALLSGPRCYYGVLCPMKDVIAVSSHSTRAHSLLLSARPTYSPRIRANVLLHA